MTRTPSGAGAGSPGLLFSPAAERNQSAINAFLATWLPGSARVLEIASGSGQHAQYLGGLHPQWTWQPTDADAAAVACIALRCAALPSIAAPVQLDVAAPAWPLPLAHFDAVYCANMLHISPEANIGALMRGAARHLRAGACLLLYGPFVEPGQPTAPGNLAFDLDLRSRNPAWGLRSLAVVQHAAQAQGLGLTERQPMPANNLLLRFRLTH